ncbi:hypothetical protein F5887DRAFT_1082652 [Amanita rubescens]|nr:hypothetical protein F5887DRAFT_1083585 [Amanita rubescens]KAF8329063.1 hypothetical protein F5887DRAFT_1082652 [Amanita rubescens]
MEVDTVEQSVLVMDVDVGKGDDDDVEMKDGEVEMSNGGHHGAVVRSICNTNESQVTPANDGDVEMKEANVEETEAMEVDNVDNNNADSDDVEMLDG